MLFSTTEELKKHLGTLHKNLDFNVLLSYVRQAEVRYLVPAFGTELVRVLGDLPAANADEKLVRLREQVRPALANYVVLTVAPQLNVAVGNLGMMEQSTQNAAPVRQWVYDKFIDGAAGSADALLEAALAFLDDNAADYAAYQNARELRDRRGLIISNAAELGRYLATAGSRRFYLGLLPALRQVEEFDIRPLLGDDRMDALTEGLANADAPSDDTRKLLGLLRPLVAHRALSMGLLHLNVAMTGGTLELISDTRAARQSAATSPAAIVALGQQAQANADRYHARLTAYLDAQRPAAPLVSAELPDNSNSRSFWV